LLFDEKHFFIKSYLNDKIFEKIWKSVVTHTHLHSPTYTHRQANKIMTCMNTIL